MLATIYCQVVWDDTTPAARRTVEAHQVLYGYPRAVERRLARGETDLTGAITLVFPAVVQGLVRVRAFGIDGVPLGGEVLTTPLSGVHRLSVSMPRPGCTRSEVERLMRAIHPWTSGQLRRLLGWEAQRLEHITQQTGKSLEQLQLLQRSAVLSEQVGVPVELLYGLGRAGLPLTLSGLARSSRVSRRRALDKAVASRWIPAPSQSTRVRHLERLSVMLRSSIWLRLLVHQQWSRWTQRELMTAVEFTTTTAMTLA